MRILLTTDTLGGVWTFTYELTRGLLSRGHQVLLVSLGREPDAQQRDDVLALACAGFRYAASSAPLEWMQNNENVVAQTAAAIKAVIRDFHPDILHANQFTAAMMQPDAPCLLTVHSDVLSWADATGTDLEPPAWRERYRQIAAEGLASADTLVAPTFALARELQRLYHLERSVEIIPNGRQLVVPASATPRILQAVSAGRLWDAAKGLAILLDIHSPLPVLLAGEQGFDQQTVDLPATVHLAGTLSTAELHALFAQSAIYLCASTYEPFGLAALEAALCGCAVIARNIPSLREVWADGAFYFGSAQQLEALLLRLSENPALLRAAQQRSLTRAQTYTADRMVDSYLERYDALHSPRPIDDCQVTEGAYAG